MCRLPELKRLRAQPVIRGRVWVEIGGVSAITEAASDLIEQIEACGSLSEAARRLGFSYRRAWLLMDGINRPWNEPVIKTATGGTRGGGARVTEFGRQLSQQLPRYSAANGTFAGSGNTRFSQAQRAL